MPGYSKQPLSMREMETLRVVIFYKHIKSAYSCCKITTKRRNV